MPSPAISAAWLTSSRLRAHGLILALCLWSFYAWNMATPGLRDRSGNLKGTDFLHFYVLGSLALQHNGADLYDMDAQAGVAIQRVPAAAGIRYLPLYPPQVSLFFAPLARLSYGYALACWAFLSLLIYVLCCYTLWRACPSLGQQHWAVLVLAIAFPGFFHAIAWGQTSVLALACFTLLFFSLRGQRAFLAGLVLGCLIFKPQLGLASAVVFISVRAWKVVAGALLSAAVQLGAAWLYYGAEPLRTWSRTFLHLRDVLPLLEPKPYWTHSLRTFWAMLFALPRLSFSLYVLSAAAVLAVTITCWRRSTPLPLRYSLLLFATALVSPHLTIYDLVILAPAFLLLADWIMSQLPIGMSRRLAALLYFAYFLPLLGPLDTWTHLQLSILAMSGIVYVLWRIAATHGEITHIRV